ncbi:MAG: ABC transporter permease subunit [Planctomycetes bacterium]|nr:ABC transporter permease subunit [Planctomycetota bacterium]
MPDVPVLDLVGSGARVVFRRELKAYFLSPIAYVFGALFLAVLLWQAAAATIVDGAPASMQPFFAYLPWLFLLFLPGLTMRLWAEERKLGTIELLLTFPVEARQVVMGKFLAVMVFLGCMLLLTLGLPLTLGAYGRLDWPATLGSYLASLLYASSYVAVGMFWSSMTRDQIIALLASIVSLALLFLLGVPQIVEGMFAGAPAWLQDLLNGLSPYKYFQSIARGVFDTRDFVYFACFCGFFLYANTLVLQVRRQQKG